MGWLPPMLTSDLIYYITNVHSDKFFVSTGKTRGLPNAMLQEGYVKKQSTQELANEKT
jgi:hypothetical protein